MRLSGRTMKFLVFALTIACHDATGPERITTFYALQSVNGQPIPAVLFSEATRTRTVVSSTLRLDEEGHAFITESDTENLQGVVSNQIFTATLEYRLHGGQIEIGSFTPCPPNALCAANATGTISNGILTLNNPLPAPNTVYVYRTIPTDPPNI
jgi:hypothetical protein